MDYFTTLGFVPISVLPSLETLSVVVNNTFLVSSKSPLVFLTVMLGFSDLFFNGSLVFQDMISVLGILCTDNYKTKVSF